MIKRRAQWVRASAPQRDEPSTDSASALITLEDALEPDPLPLASPKAVPSPPGVLAMSFCRAIPRDGHEVKAGLRGHLAGVGAPLPPRRRDPDDCGAPGALAISLPSPSQAENFTRPWPFANNPRHGKETESQPIANAIGAELGHIPPGRMGIGMRRCSRSAIDAAARAEPGLTSSDSVLAHPGNAMVHLEIIRSKRSRTAQHNVFSLYGFQK